MNNKSYTNTFKNNISKLIFHYKYTVVHSIIIYYILYYSGILSINLASNEIQDGGGNTQSYNYLIINIVITFTHHILFVICLNTIRIHILYLIRKFYHTSMIRIFITIKLALLASIIVFNNTFNIVNSPIIDTPIITVSLFHIIFFTIILYILEKYLFFAEHDSLYDIILTVVAPKYQIKTGHMIYE